MKPSTSAYHSISIQVTALLQKYCLQQPLRPDMASHVQPIWDFLKSIFKSARQQQQLQAFSKTSFGKQEATLLQMIDAKIATDPKFQVQLRTLLDNIPEEQACASHDTQDRPDGDSDVTVPGRVNVGAKAKVDVAKLLTISIHPELN